MTVQFIKHDAQLRHAVDEAVRDLVTHRHEDGVSYVNLPLAYPDGSWATVRVDRVKGGFRVSDNCFAYRLIETLGAQRSFSGAARHLAEAHGLMAGKTSLYADIAADDLPRAIADVAAASWALADRVCRQIAPGGEAAIEARLNARLKSLFGQEHIARERTIQGPSSHTWTVSAIVSVKGERAIFHAVANNAHSVYHASAAFHDLCTLDAPPRLIAVVQSKPDMGALGQLLSNVGHVIEQDSGDESYWQAVA